MTMERENTDCEISLVPYVYHVIFWHIVSRNLLTHTRVIGPFHQEQWDYNANHVKKNMKC